MNLMEKSKFKKGDHVLFAGTQFDETGDCDDYFYGGMQESDMRLLEGVVIDISIAIGAYPEGDNKTTVYTISFLDIYDGRHAKTVGEDDLVDGNEAAYPNKRVVKSIKDLANF